MQKKMHIHPTLSFLCKRPSARYYIEAPVIPNPTLQHVPSTPSVQAAHLLQVVQPFSKTSGQHLQCRPRPVPDSQNALHKQIRVMKDEGE